ncbi:hypothetical protein HPB52_001207 [Rhipicephalus sanguineus]|uniref:Zinc finger PHD-type domain-containing protein n=1 Tax=Rhipicephalus sanguineus TaxID=34632 RepID=A0A9D4PWA3_RHISA|nr:hypothetical protein HPB52_001207 [Rhipicephalus sanguineus]
MSVVASSASCRWAPLIQCDYCPLLFHADCLEFPLASLPTGRWMCPNHAENYLEEKLLNSVSLTERVRLWDRFGGGSRLNQDAVKLAFLTRAHRPHPPFRLKRWEVNQLDEKLVRLLAWQRLQQLLPVNGVNGGCVQGHTIEAMEILPVDID